MAHRFINIDRHTPLLLAPDLRDWVPEDDLVHLVLEAVAGMTRLPLKVNRRGSGSAQYPPHTMLALLIYCYANGLFSSRKIERATYNLVSVRYLMADHHPDHDTICTFRRENKQAISQAFVEVLKLARQMGVLKVGTVSIDGTHLRASASKDRNVRYDRAGELQKQLEGDVEQLMQKAEEADREDDDTAGGQKLPGQIKRLSTLRDKLREARQALEHEAKELAESQKPAYEKMLADREQRGRGQVPKPPVETPRPERQMNLTDRDSRLMRKTRRSSYEQSYNAQAVVDADGSMLILSGHISQCSNDSNELIRALDGVSDEVGQVTAVLADTGYAKVQTLEELEKRGVDAYVAVGRPLNHDQRTYDFRPESAPRRPGRKVTDKRLLAMQQKLETEHGRQMYQRRKQTVEPVFGIIKSVLGFRQFLTRGLAQVSNEWTLVSLAYNLKRMAKLAAI